MPKKTQAINIDLTTFIALLKILLGIPVRLVRGPRLHQEHLYLFESLVTLLARQPQLHST